ncbi:MAG: coenzyme F420-0:L-glutamate ligase [Actinomycetota bacterium]
MTVEILPVPGVPEVRPGDDLVSLLATPLERIGVRDGDVIAVTQKVVSKAENRVVPEQPIGRAAWIARETERVVASKGELIIAETAHGFVCANAGVDASNVPDGALSLLPVDPDGSAEQLRAGLSARLAADLAVVITDTFGRAWRTGVVNVAIGCAGLAALVDLRGEPDHHGRTLDATVVALADEVAAASGLVMPKAGGIPAALVRGAPLGSPAGRASDLVRPSEEDLFRETPLTAISARRTIRAFGPGPVEREAVRAAVRAACTAPAPHHTKPWTFVALWSAAAKHRYLEAMARAWRADLERDGTEVETIDRRIAASDAVLGAAPVLVVPALQLGGSHDYPDEERTRAERDMFLLSGGAAIQNLLLALHAQGLASSWISSSIFCREEARAAIGLDERWLPLGTVAAGRPPATSVPQRPSLPLDEHLRDVD